MGEDYLEIETIAAIAHEANRVYCESIGDFSQPLWRDAPAWQTDSAIAGVKAIRDGTVTKPSDSHVSWSEQKLREGWQYGPVKNPDRKEHPCLVPFNMLPFSQQIKDHIFFNVVSGLLNIKPE